VQLALGEAEAGRSTIRSALPPLSRGFGEGHWLVGEARTALGGA
jgi:hypothetical protein